MAGPLNIAAVNYLNAKPLWESLRCLPGVELSLARPSRCADLLIRGGCQVALVPTFEILRRPELRALGRGVVAGTDRAVTVLLLSPCPLERLVALRPDPASRSSNALAQIILRERGLDMPLLRPGLRAPASRTAQVCIGDKAFTPPSSPVVLDLGQEWHTLTGLPFVFARWATRHLDPPSAWEQLLDEALEQGLGRRQAIAREAASALQLPTWVLEDYLCGALRHELIPAHLESLELFADHLGGLGLIPARSVTLAQKEMA